MVEGGGGAAGGEFDLKPSKEQLEGRGGGGEGTMPFCYSGFF